MKRIETPKFMKDLHSPYTRGNRAWYENVYQDGECLTSSNIRNKDGYLRVNSGINNNTLKMAHILVYEHLNGPIPKGKEVNHKCLNRACFNPIHLELLDGSEHATLTNNNRKGYAQQSWSDYDICDFYYRVKYEGESINEVVRKEGIKRSTMSSIINKRSRCKITDMLDEYFKN